MRQPAVLIDRDGTLASVKHHMGVDGPDCWHCYNGLLVFDAVVPIVAGLLRSIRPGITRIMTTGRMDSMEYPMRTWIRKHDLPIDLLLMRKDKDQRRDSVVKTEIYRTLIEPFYDVKFVIDDRPQVVQAWRALSLPVLAVKDPGVLPAILGT